MKEPKKIQEIIRAREISPFVYEDQVERYIGKRTGKPIVYKSNDANDSGFQRFSHSNSLKHPNSISQSLEGHTDTLDEVLLNLKDARDKEEGCNSKGDVQVNSNSSQAVEGEMDTKPYQHRRLANLPQILQQKGSPKESHRSEVLRKKESVKDANNLQKRASGINLRKDEIMPRVSTRLVTKQDDEEVFNFRCSSIRKRNNNDDTELGDLRDFLGEERVVNRSKPTYRNTQVVQSRPEEKKKPPNYRKKKNKAILDKEKEEKQRQEERRASTEIDQKPPNKKVKRNEGDRREISVDVDDVLLRCQSRDSRKEEQKSELVFNERQPSKKIEQEKSSDTKQKRMEGENKNLARKRERSEVSSETESEKKREREIQKRKLNNKKRQQRKLQKNLEAQEKIWKERLQKEEEGKELLRQQEQEARIKREEQKEIKEEQEREKERKHQKNQKHSSKENERSVERSEPSLETQTVGLQSKPSKPKRKNNRSKPSASNDSKSSEPSVDTKVKKHRKAPSRSKSNQSSASNSPSRSLSKSTKNTKNRARRSKGMGLLSLDMKDESNQSSSLSRNEQISSLEKEDSKFIALESIQSCKRGPGKRSRMPRMQFEWERGVYEYGKLIGIVSKNSSMWKNNEILTEIREEKPSLKEDFNLFIEKILGPNPAVEFSEISRKSNQLVLFAEMKSERVLLTSTLGNWKTIKIESLQSAKRNTNVEVYGPDGEKKQEDLKNIWNFYMGEDFEARGIRKNATFTILKLTISY